MDQNASRALIQAGQAVLGIEFGSHADQGRAGGTDKATPWPVGHTPTGKTGWKTASGPIAWKTSTKACKVAMLP